MNDKVDFQKQMLDFSKLLFSLSMNEADKNNFDYAHAYGFAIGSMAHALASLCCYISSYQNKMVDDDLIEHARKTFINAFDVSLIEFKKRIPELRDYILKNKSTNDQ